MGPGLPWARLFSYMQFNTFKLRNVFLKFLQVFKWLSHLLIKQPISTQQVLSTLHVEILCITCQMHLLPNLVGNNKEGLYMMGMETSFFRTTKVYSRHLCLTRSNYISLFLRKYEADNEQNL